MRRELRDEIPQPRAGRQHETLRAIHALPRCHAYAVAVPLPRRHGLFEAQRRAVALGDPQMGFDAPLRSEPSGLRVEEPDPAIVDLEHRPALSELRRVELLVCETVLLRGPQRSRDELAVGRAEVHAAGLHQERLAGLALELAPEVPGPAEQRDVVRVLVIGEADDPREPAARSQRVPARETVESQHVLATFCEVVRGRAPVGAQTDDDRVVDVLGHAGLSVREGCIGRPIACQTRRGGPETPTRAFAPKRSHLGSRRGAERPRTNAGAREGHPPRNRDNRHRAANAFWRRPSVIRRQDLDLSRLWPGVRVDCW